MDDEWLEKLLDAISHCITTGYFIAYAVDDRNIYLGYDRFIYDRFSVWWI